MGKCVTVHSEFVSLLLRLPVAVGLTLTSLSRWSENRLNGSSTWESNRDIKIPKSQQGEKILVIPLSGNYKIKTVFLFFFASGVQLSLSPEVSDQPGLPVRVTFPDRGEHH